MNINSFSKVFFVGVAGAGMSALAQYLRGLGKQVAGSDRYFLTGENDLIKRQLEAEGIICYPQGESIISKDTDLVVVSTAIEDSVPEVRHAKAQNIPIIKRSALLAIICKSRKTIAVAGTSGKSSTSAMIFDILSYAGYEPGIISGAGLTHLIRKGKIGNAYVGKGEWLVIEADESDGSIVEYKPEIGLLLNIDKDHQEIDELMRLFKTFIQNTKDKVSVNADNKLAASLSVDPQNDFTTAGKEAGFKADNFKQSGFEIQFTLNDSPFTMHAIGRHNMENAVAAASICNLAGVPLDKCAEALKSYEGIYRRTQVLGKAGNVWFIDDYAHNPAKCAAAIRACQPLAKKLIAWFQPHGYGPTKFLRKEFAEELSRSLREEDLIIMSEIYYAGGTAVKDISAADLINDLKEKGSNAYFVENRDELADFLKQHIEEDSAVLLMGARDPGLETFSKNIFGALSKTN